VKQSGCRCDSARLRVGLVCAVLAILSAAHGTAIAERYACEQNVLEVMFVQEAEVRLRGGTLVDLAAAKGLTRVGEVLNDLDWYEWAPFSPVSEARLDEMHAVSAAKSGQDIYNLNNIYRLSIPLGHDIWAIAESLEALPGVLSARPVPKPMPLPTPPNYVPNQGYLRPASSTPTGIDADYAWGFTGGNGSGVTICDLEYSWNYNHADVTKALGSQINSNIADPFSNNNHGTAVIGMLVADNNGWGITGICHGASLLTCGTYYGTPTPSWNVPGAIALAMSHLSPGDVILLEHQWDYTGSAAYIPIEWWTNYSPGAQTFNAAYAAIIMAINNGISVVEAGGNGGVNTSAMAWYGDNGAAIVGAGGAYPGGTYPEGDLQRISVSSYGWRYHLQGWGENVYTTGYGTLYNAEGVNYYYTNFSLAGTSSASPCVAGAIACCVGYYMANINPTPPSPTYLRDNLNITGTLQVIPPAGTIGQRPDLQAMFTFMTPVCNCPYQSDFDTDGFLTALDLSEMIDILFAGHADVRDTDCPSPRADFDCDGFSTALDLSGLIDHLFAGGAGPCDPCAP
jgi:serine protease